MDMDRYIEELVKEINPNRILRLSIEILFGLMFLVLFGGFLLMIVIGGL